MKIIKFCIAGFLLITIAGCSKPQEVIPPPSQPTSEPVSIPEPPAKKSHIVRYTVSNAQDYMMRDNFTIKYTDGNEQKSVETKSDWETTVTAYDGDELHLMYLPSGKDGAAFLQGIARIYVDNNLLQEKTGIIVDCTYTIPLITNASSPSNAQLQQELEMLKQKQRVEDQQRMQENKRQELKKINEQNEKVRYQQDIIWHEDEIKKLQEQKKDLVRRQIDARTREEAKRIQTEIESVDSDIAKEEDQINLLKSWIK